MPRYTAQLTDDKGNQIAPLNNLSSLSYTEGFNRINSGSILYRGTFPVKFKDLRRDMIFQIWRKAGDDTSKRLVNAFMLRKWRIWEDNSAVLNVMLKGVDMNDLMRRRIVAYFSESTQAFKVAAPLDNIMKQVIRENLGALSNTDYDGNATDRDLTSAGLSVEPDSGKGILLSKAFAWQETVFSVVKQLHDISRVMLPVIHFSIVPVFASNGQVRWEFRTFPDFPSRDLTDGAIPPFTVAAGSLSQPSIEFNFMGESTLAYGLSTGFKDTKIVKEVRRENRETSQWARIETIADASRELTPDAVLSAAESKLNEKRPKTIFKATLLATKQTQYGTPKGWVVGDKVPVEWLDFSFDAIIEETSVTYANDKETVKTSVLVELGEDG